MTRARRAAGCYDVRRGNAVTLVVALLIWAGIVVASMLLATWFAVRWGRDPFGWVLLSAVLGPIALVGLVGTHQSDVARPEPAPRSANQQSILAAVDGSPASEHIAEYVAATYPGASNVVLLAVLSHDARPAAGAPLRAEEQRRVEAMFARAQQIIAGDGLPVRTKIAYGAAGEAIVRAADEENASVVVIGRRGAGLSKALLGSTSDYVVKHSTRPVVVID